MTTIPPVYVLGMADTLSISEIELYKILKTKLGDKEAKSVIEYVESKI